MFESLTLTTILLVLFFFYQNMRWGLTSAIPKDSQARLRFYCSECLTSLKSLLAGAHIDQLQADSVSFNGGQRLRFEAGQLVLETPGQKQQILQTLGPRGQLYFEKTSPTALVATIQAQEEDLSHRIAVRLEVQFAEAV